MIKPPSEILRALKEGKVSTWNKWAYQQVGGVDLTGADLAGADLAGAGMVCANLWCADMRHANLERADLRDANLRLASLPDANLLDANLERANLTGANLTGANLTGANLRRANTRRANLTGANLTGANLQGAWLQHTDLTCASLAGTGVLPKWFGGLRCNITPSHAWLECRGGTHEYWESLTEDEALSIDGFARLLWPHRDELLAMMKQCREEAWPLLSDK